MSKNRKPIRWFPLDRIDELESAIADAAGDANLVAARHGLACALGLHGLRVTEVCRAEAKHFQPELRSLYVETIKEGVPRTVKLHQSIIDRLIAWRKSAGLERSRFLLPNNRGGQMGSRKASAFGLELLRRLGVTFNPRFHMFRHTFAMRLLAETDDVVLVKNQLGHASIETTMIYVDSLKQVPDSCLVKLESKPKHDPQLKLFNPDKMRGNDESLGVNRKAE
jgi:integrase